MGYNGNLVSELGVKKYLKGYEANKYSNIDILQTRQELERRWEACDFGCHGPAYRVMRRDAQYSEQLNKIAGHSPVVAGIVDGVAASTAFATDRRLEGVQRTAEGLGLAGQDMQSQVGAENYALYISVKVNVETLLNFEIEQFENPFSKITLSIVNEYIRLLPEKMILEMVIAGSIILEPSDDIEFYKAAMDSGMLEEYNEHIVNESVSILRSKGERLLGKQIGKKIPKVLAGIIASRITRAMMINAKSDFHFKRKLARLRSTYRSLGGKPATLLITLLDLNGWLGIAARESRDLHDRCPTLWSFLRFDLNGVDMLYFLIKDFFKEYIDRIALIETDPAAFVGLMGALVQAGRTREIFFPR